MTTQQFDLKTKTEDVYAEKTGMFNKLNDLKAQGARLLTITALDHGKEIEFVYNFEKGIDVVNLRVKTPREEAMPSITSLYPSALLYENELQDLFKIRILRNKRRLRRQAPHDRGRRRYDASQACGWPRPVHQAVLWTLPRAVPRDGQRPKIHTPDSGG